MIRTAVIYLPRICRGHYLRNMWPSIVEKKQPTLKGRVSEVES
jgi:hypothetical protein